MGETAKLCSFGVFGGLVSGGESWFLFLFGVPGGFGGVFFGVCNRASLGVVGGVCRL